MVEATCLFWIREHRLGGSELGSSTQVQRLEVGIRHGKLGSDVEKLGSDVEKLG